MQAVADRNGVRVLRFNHERGFGYEPFKLPFVLLVARVECLIGENEAGVTQVCVEVPREMPSITQVEEMLAKQGANGTGEDPLPCTTSSPQNESNLSCLARFLHRPG